LLINDSLSDLQRLLFFCQISQDSILLSFPSDNPRCYLRSILSVPDIISDKCLGDPGIQGTSTGNSVCMGR
jgi:hypothetical protein